MTKDELIALAERHGAFAPYDHPTSFCFTLADLSAFAADLLQQPGWHDVRTDGLPPCDGETVYVGENEAGYMGCFNHINPDGLTLMGSPEACETVFSGLRYWRIQDRPFAVSQASTATVESLITEAAEAYSQGYPVNFTLVSQEVVRAVEGGV